MAVDLVGGGTELKPALLADGTCECCRLAAARDPAGGLVVLSRMVYPGGIRDFGLIRDGATGPATTSRLTDDDWQIDACPENGGALSIDAEWPLPLRLVYPGQAPAGICSTPTRTTGARPGHPAAPG